VTVRGLLVVLASRHSRVNTQAGALSLVVSRHVVYERAAGQDPVRKMDNGKPRSPGVHLEASPGGSPLGETRPLTKPHRREVQEAYSGSGGI
jgi:hypothetical protein